MIIACMIVYNEAENIARAIESIAPFVDRLVVLDGAFEAFMRVNNLKNFLSDDGTREIVFQLKQKYSNIEFVEPFRPWKSEVEKRSYFFRLGRPNDIFFVVDGDEEVTGDIEAGLSIVAAAKHNFYQVLIHDLNYNTKIWRIRLYRWQPNMRYVSNHWTVVGDDYYVHYVDAEPPTCPRLPITIINYGHGGERKIMRDNYMQYMATRNWSEP
jgi:hypothetical protein